MHINYEFFYNKLTHKLLEKKLLIKMFVVIEKSLELLMYLSYITMLIYLIIKDGLSYTIPYVIVPGTSFVLVSMVRKFINRKRPYETWNIKPIIKKDTKGQSMPSRHVFSASIITMCILNLYLPLGIIYIIFSLLMAIFRVIGGVHYPSDVILGLIIGFSLGSVLFFI